MVALVKRMLADGGALHQLASCVEEKQLRFQTPLPDSAFCLRTVFQPGNSSADIIS